MANQFRGRGRIGAAVRRPKRVTQWLGSADQGFVSVGGGAKLLIQSNATLGNTTIVRVRGVVSVQPDTSAADFDVLGAYGIGIVSDQAFAAGAASLPGPWSDPDWSGWLVWSAILNGTACDSAITTNVSFKPTFRIDLLSITV